MTFPKGGAAAKRPFVENVAKVSLEPSLADASLNINDGFAGSCRACSIMFHMDLDPPAEAFGNQTRTLLQRLSRFVSNVLNDCTQTGALGAIKFASRPRAHHGHNS